jgi:hypothetical protein
MAAHQAGQNREAAARFIQQHPDDARLEDAAYMRVLALRGPVTKRACERPRATICAVIP